MGRSEERCFLTVKLSTGWENPSEMAMDGGVPRDGGARGQVQNVGHCEGTCLQGRRGLFWLQVGCNGGCEIRAAQGTSPGIRVQGPGPVRLLLRASEGWRERRGRRKEAGTRLWKTSPGLVEGWEGREAAPEEGRRRRGREGMLLNSFLP